MKKWLGACVLGVCLTVLPMPALAVHWMSLGSSEEGEILMDRDSLKRPADTSLTVWEKVLWPQSDAHGRTGELRHREYDMKGKKWRQLSSYQLDARGRKTAGNRKIQEWQEFQPMTSLFEQSLLLLGDIVAKMIIERRGLDMKALWRYHANLE